MAFDFERALKLVKTGESPITPEQLGTSQIVVLASADVEADWSEASEPGSLKKWLFSSPFEHTWFEFAEGGFMRDDEMFKSNGTRLYGFYLGEISNNPLTFQFQAFSNHGFIPGLVAVVDGELVLRPHNGSSELDVSGDYEGKFKATNYLFHAVAHCLKTYLHKDSRVASSVQLFKNKHGRMEPRDVVYVKKTKTVYHNGSKIPLSIDWKHSWRVAGCWVRIRGIGKDRSGKRVMKGITWRVPHVKGDGPLVEKIRVRLSEKSLPSKDASDIGV